MASRTRMHLCPGKCRRMVPHRLFACRGCWGRLPREFQQPILDATRGTNAHLMAMRAACDWYREQEPEQPTPAADYDSIEDPDA